MKTRKFTDEQIALALRQAEGGTPFAEICRRLGVSEQTFYRWKKRCGALGLSELRELRQLPEENRKLKGLVANLSLDKTILHEALRKHGEARRPPSAPALGSGGVPDVRASGLSPRRRLPGADSLSQSPTIAGAPAGTFARARRGPSACRL
jgi:putative transposase